MFGLAWAFVAHTDSHFDPDLLRRYLSAYQTIQPLTIGELWAVAITLRIALVENLRRLADQMTAGRAARGEADVLADRLLAAGDARSALERDIDPFAGAAFGAVRGAVGGAVEGSRSPHDPSFGMVGSTPAHSRGLRR